MGQIQARKAWGFLSLLVILMSGGSLAFAQTNTFPNDGNVGIGTASPVSTLHVSGSIRAVGNGEFVGISDSDLNNSFYLTNDGTTATLVYNKSGGNIGVLTNSGNVGIGTASPSSKLHVAGDAKITGDLTVDGNIGAKYQDVAEWVRAGAALEPGTVVVIDPLENNRVLPASQAYDTRVAGVVSAQPGIILGEPGEDKVKVAHGGRVKVKADARFGPIQVGDLLVSSGTPGFAMRSAPVEVSGISLHRPGTIVGKALEPLKEGQGEILVLLTLQ